MSKTAEHIFGRGAGVQCSLNDRSVRRSVGRSVCLSVCLLVNGLASHLASISANEGPGRAVIVIECREVNTTQCSAQLLE